MTKITKPVARTIEEEYIATHPTSEMLYRRALDLIPSGIEHDGRYIKPFPIYVVRADKARKWDVDGHEYIDLWSGHGALILGHNHPAVVAAVIEQINKGFHYSSCHELQLELAEMIIRLVPCAERVRWMQSGTEANMLAIRIARAYTGRNKVIKFRGHFHGYWDEGMVGVRPPFDRPMSIGIPKESQSNVLLADHNSSEDVRRLIDESKDVACVIMDPIGHGFVSINRPGFLEEVRQVTKEKGVVLIFDEVVAGFRLAPGGAEEAFGVIPDLATLAKPIGGGLPGSVVVGRKEIMDVLSFKDDPEHDRFHRVISQGTHSANPVVCAAGLATLKVLSTGEPQAYINKLGVIFRRIMNEVIRKHGIPGCVYGKYSTGRFFLGHDCPYMGQCDPDNCTFPDDEKRDAGTPPAIRTKLYLAMLLNDVDYIPGLAHCFLNAAVTEQDLEKIAQAFDKSLSRLKQEGIL